MMTDKERIIHDRLQSYKYMMLRYTAEERHLVIFRRDFDTFLKSAEYLCTAGKQTQKCYDFIVCYESLLQKMNKYKWSRLYLYKHGIDVGAVEMLYGLLQNP